MLHAMRLGPAAMAFGRSVLGMREGATRLVADPVRVLLLAEGGAPTLQALQCLRLADAEVHVLGRPQAATLRWSGACRSFELFDFHPRANPTECSAARIDTLARKHRIDVVVPVGDVAAELLGQVRDGLPARCFPLASRSSIRRLNNLAWFCELCRGLDLPMPRSVVFDNKHRVEPDRLGETFGFPVVVRSCDLARGLGVVIAHSSDELRRRVLDNPAYDDTPLIAQEHVPGEKVDLNLIAVNGRIVAHSVQRRKADGVTFRDEPALLAHARILVEATHYSGPAHLKAVRGARDGGIRVLGCRGRMWGSMAAAAECGVNLPAIGLAVAMGRPVLARSIPDGTTVRPTVPGLRVMLAGLAANLLWR